MPALAGAVWLTATRGPRRVEEGGAAVGNVRADIQLDPPTRCPHAPDPLGERRRPTHVLADLEDAVGRVCAVGVGLRHLPPHCAFCHVHLALHSRAVSERELEQLRERCPADASLLALRDAVGAREPAGALGVSVLEEPCNVEALFRETICKRPNQEAP